MTKTIRIPKPVDPFHRTIQRLLIGRRSKAIETDVLKAAVIISRHHEEVGNKPDRTPAQSEMLSSIPPITAFMGMGG